MHIGQTPLIRLERMAPPNGVEIRVQVGGCPPHRQHEGGISSGANVWMALERAKHLPAGARIVTTASDSGLKYLKGDLYR